MAQNRLRGPTTIGRLYPPRPGVLFLKRSTWTSLNLQAGTRHESDTRTDISNYVYRLQPDRGADLKVDDRNRDYALYIYM